VTTEANIMREIQLALSGERIRLFRNNVGMLQDKKGEYVRYGLAPGSSDLIGLRSVLVTPGMVGEHIAVFVAIEVKSPNARKPTEEQLRFVAMVEALGGRAGFATSVSEALAIISTPV
jgi:hypothetical protein